VVVLLQLIVSPVSPGACSPSDHTAGQDSARGAVPWPSGPRWNPRRRGRLGYDALGDARAAQRGGRDLTLASAFVARWCASSKIETTGGVFQVREDEPAPRVGGGTTSDTASAARMSRASANSEAASGKLNRVERGQMVAARGL